MVKESLINLLPSHGPRNCGYCHTSKSSNKYGFWAQTLTSQVFTKTWCHCSCASLTSSQALPTAHWPRMAKASCRSLLSPLFSSYVSLYRPKIVAHAQLNNAYHQIRQIPLQAQPENQLLFTIHSQVETDREVSSVLTKHLRVNALDFKPKKSQKKIVIHFNRYVEGTWHSDKGKDTNGDGNVSKRYSLLNDLFLLICFAHMSSYFQGQDGIYTVYCQCRQRNPSG